MTPLTQLLAMRGVKFRKHQSEINVCCPFCTDRGESQDTRFRLGINLDTKEGHCFNCDWKSRSAPAFYLRKLGMPEEYFQEEAEVAVAKDVLRLPEDFTLLTLVGNSRLERRAFRYIADRGISKLQITKHRVGVSFAGRFAYRIVFPIYHQKRLQMLVGRDFTNISKLRYLNSTGEKPLFGAIGKSKVVLSEGIFKALSLETALQHSDWCSSALLGHNITPLQLSQLSAYKISEVAVWPDPDRVGILGAVDVADTLAENGFSVSFVPPATKQADELTPEERTSYWDQRVPWAWNVRAKIKCLARP